MPRFRKKPVEVEAFQFDPAMWDPMPDWIPMTALYHTHVLNEDGTKSRGETILRLETLEGTMTAREGDWVVKSVEGELYVYKHEVFEEMYEEIEE